MGISLVIGPASDPVSLSEARDHCRLDNNESDGLLAGYVLAARRYAEGYTRRAFVTQTWDATFDYHWPTVCGQIQIDLPLPPLASVSYVSYVGDYASYVGDIGVTQTLASNQYRVLTDGPFGRIVPAQGVSWPTVRWQRNAITVRFVAGWDPSAVPDEIRTAILLHTELLFDRDPAMQSCLESSRDALLDHYRVVRVL